MTVTCKLCHAIINSPPIIGDERATSIQLGMKLREHTMAKHKAEHEKAAFEALKKLQVIEQTCLMTVCMGGYSSSDPSFAASLVGQFEAAEKLFGEFRPVEEKALV